MLLNGIIELIFLFFVKTTYIWIKSSAINYIIIILAYFSTFKGEYASSERRRECASASQSTKKQFLFLLFWVYFEAKKISFCKYLTNIYSDSPLQDIGTHI